MKLEQASQSMTYGGAGTAIASGLTLNEIGVIVGIMVGVIGLAAQIWFGYRRDRRELEAHRFRKEWAEDDN